MVRYIKIISLALLTLSFSNLFAVKDSSDLVVDIERINRIEILSRNLHEKLHPTCSVKPGDEANIEFENNRIPLSEEEFILNSHLLESGVPMQYNNRVEHLINYFATSWQTKLKDMLVVSNYYFPIYEEIFDKYDIPLEIKYLSVIESALNPHAVSVSGAAGLWQFMYATGKIFDLKVNNYVDERRNVEKSTIAACKYLKSMYERYGDWYLVIASYNCGPGNVNKAIVRSGGKKTFWEIYNYLPKETQNYVPAFIAMTYIMNFYEMYGITPSIDIDNKPRLVKVDCNSDYSFDIICNILEINSDDLKSYNPELKKTILPSAHSTFTLKLPYEKAVLFWQMEDSIDRASSRIKEWKPPVKDEKYVSKSKSGRSKTYKVKKGESLMAIARKFDCKIWQLRSWNGLKSNKIYPGQKLIIKNS
ncbi:MAG: transglycosylase SLT domain-containing protein [Bacteroidia bacterium]|nr:transglycosylase SLT domain-containing protein [Bacteroidia bacterium]